MTRQEAWRDMSMMAGHWALKGFGHWVLEERDSGELVGRAGLYFPPTWPALEVGWTVARAHWGKGYAGEAGRAACEWAHDELGARHIVSLILPTNSQSIRVAEKLGEKPEGKHRSWSSSCSSTAGTCRLIQRADGRVGSAHDDDRGDT